jgi:hypothetical protein
VEKKYDKRVFDVGALKPLFFLMSEDNEAFTMETCRG